MDVKRQLLIETSEPEAAVDMMALVGLPSLNMYYANARAFSPLCLSSSSPSKRSKFEHRKGGIKPWPLQISQQKVLQIGTRTHQGNAIENCVSANRSILANAVIVGALSLSISLCGLGRADAKERVNKPELLPLEFTPLIDVAGFLSPGQESRIIQEIIDLEKDTGFKLRVLAQNYPETPGLAVRDFWQVDDNTVVFVADPTFGNILNFNVGASIDLNIPRSFWGRLAGKYGNLFYWREKGEDASIEAAVSAVSSCLREPQGPNACSEIK